MTNGARLADADHLVGHVDTDRRLASLGGESAGAEFGTDDVIVSADPVLDVVASAVIGCSLSADTASFFHQLDVAVASGLHVEIIIARHGRRTWRDHDIRRRVVLTLCDGLVDQIAVATTIGRHAGDYAP